MQNLTLFLFSAFAQFLLCLLISYAAKGELNDSKKLLRRSFYLLGVAIVVWCGSQYAYDISGEVSFQEKALKFGVVATILVAYAFLFFARQLMQHTPSIWQRRIEFLLLGSSVIVAVFASVASVSIVDSEIVYTYHGLLYFILTIVPVAFITLGVVALESYARKHKHAYLFNARQAKYVSRGMILTTIFAFSGNILLTLIGFEGSFVADLFVAGAPAVYTLFIAYTVFSLRLFNFRRFFLRVVAFGVVFVSVYIIVLMTPLNIAEDILSRNSKLNFIVIVGLSLAAYQIAGAVTNWMFKIITQSSEGPSIESNPEYRSVLRSIETEEVLKGVAGVITKTFLFHSVSIAVFTKENFEGLKVYTGGEKAKGLDQDHLAPLLEQSLDKSFIEASTLSKAGIKGYQMGYIINRDFVKGVMLIGQKTNGRPIYDDERLALLRITNELTLALENTLQYYKIQRFSEDLEQKVADATRELRRTNDKLKALDEAKDEFISMASHQLRTPLTSVKGYVSMVLDGDAGPINDQQQKLLEQSFISSQRMVYLIADLLNVSRLRTGKFVIEAKPTYLPDIVQGEMQQLVETAAARGLELTFDKPHEFPTLNLDETKIRQVVMNFMDNAIYYTPVGGRIRVELSATDHAVEYRVVDDGLGVPKAEQHHLFTKFYRAGNARKARPDGTGLGLFMAKKVVIAQGGAIIFRSQENKGSTFGFSFPRKNLEVVK